MAVEEALKSVSFPANADLSASQYCFVVLNSSGNVAVAGAGVEATGVLQNKPDAAGRAATVAINGRTKMKFSASIAVGLPVASDASGQAAAAASGEMSLGIVTENPGGSGLIGSILIAPMATVG